MKNKYICLFLNLSHLNTQINKITHYLNFKTSENREMLGLNKKKVM